jgi:hypothetical protein
VKPSELFDLAYERYESLRETVGATPSVTYHDSQGGGQGIVGLPPVEYCADFEMAAARALRKWPARVEFFRLHFLCFDDDLAAIAKRLKLSENSAWQWKWSLQNVVGNELMKCGKVGRKSGAFYFTKHYARGRNTMRRETEIEIEAGQ